MPRAHISLALAPPSAVDCTWGALLCVIGACEIHQQVKRNGGDNKCNQGEFGGSQTGDRKNSICIGDPLRERNTDKCHSALNALHLRTQDVPLAYCTMVLLCN